MGLLYHHRKLMPEICELICHRKKFVSCSSDADCSVCFNICLTNPQYPYYYSPPPPPQVPSSFYLDHEDDQSQHKISTYLILSLSLLAAVFFFICCRLIYTKLIRSRRRVLLSSTHQTEETRDDFLDEEHGPTVDHPIWYIRTVGLHQSVINAITVCKYKKGEGLIEGTDCSVCLSEFEEDESLRLLPKCHHAFHLPCIDTWLSSHTNCPLCRAPIVTNNPAATTTIPSLDSIVIVDSSSLENNASDSELRNEAQEEEGRLEVAEAVSGIQPRRSVSLDDHTLAANINLSLATVLSVEESNGNSDRVVGVISVNEHTASKVTGIENLATASISKGSYSFRSARYMQVQGVLHSPMKRSRSYNGKYLLSRSHKKKNPNAILSNVLKTEPDMERVRPPEHDSTILNRSQNSD